jgi:hypothetical protein
VKYPNAGNTSESVTLTVLDPSGNLVYSEEIALNQATRVKEPMVPSLKLYPNPAVDDIHIQLGESIYSNVQVDIYNSLGQKLISKEFTEASASSEISLSVMTLKHGVYYARVLGIGSSPVTLSFIK